MAPSWLAGEPGAVQTGALYADINACTVDKSLKCDVFTLISELLNSYFPNGLPGPGWAQAWLPHCSSSNLRG